MKILSEIGHVENPSAKILFTQVTQTAPGVCGICGKGQDPRGFVDTGLNFEYWGKLYLDFDCVVQIAAVFGLISPAEYEELLGERDLATLELHQAQGRVLDLEKVIEGLTNLRDYFSTVSTGTFDPLEEELTRSPETEQPSIPKPISPDGSDSIKFGKTPEPPRKQGLLNL
jgi:hypothetical protein